MNAEIVMIGSELLLGQNVDTNATFMGKTLAENAIPLYRKTTVGDNMARLCDVLNNALDRADVVLTSGGLGPTEDDLTRDAVAEVTGRPLEFRQDLLEQLERRFASLHRQMTENNRKQAFAPRGATALVNPHGTAPGLIVEDRRGYVICMPGVPRELYPMLTDQVVPFIRERYALGGVLHSRVLKVCGIGESTIDNIIGDLVKTQENPTVGMLASPESVRIRVTARAATTEEAERMIDPLDGQIRKRLPGLVMGIDDATLEGAVDGLLNERGWTLTLAESHTGGMVSQRLTAAQADCFAGGEVRWLEPMTGDEAAQRARRMAFEVRERFESGAALASAPTDEGRCRACFLTPDDEAAWDLGFGGRGDRQQLRSSVIMLEQVRRRLLGVQDIPF